MAGNILSENLTSLENVLQPKPCDRLYTVMGVVVEYRTPIMTRTQEYTMSFVLVDRSRGSPRVEVRFFAEDERALPSIASEGDIILLAGVKVSRFRGNVLLVPDKQQLRYILSRVDSTPGTASLSYYPDGMLMSGPDLKRLAELRNWWRSRGGGAAGPGVASSSSAGATTSSAGTTTSSSIGRRPANPSQPASASPGSGLRPQKFALVRDMVHGRFYDMVGMVVKHFDVGKWVSLYVTDFTDHPRLYPYDPKDYADHGRQGWLGPWGQYTIQVLLWDKNAEEARKTIREGRFVLLKNMRVKENNDTTPCYEGVLHGDQRFSDRANLVVIDNLSDPRVRDILVREREYQRKQGSHESVGEMQKILQAKAVRGEKRKREEDEDVDRLLKGIEDPPQDANRRVKCAMDTKPVIAIDYIRTGYYCEPAKGFANLKYRIFCKVIDYQPERLEDFARLESSSDDADEGWTWRFALLVQGRDNATMQVIVHGEDAECLLKSEATDLRKDADALKDLRKKLSILWGNLEQTKAGQMATVENAAAPPAGNQAKRQRRARNKQKRVDSPPRFFSAAVKEFGVEQEDGTVRRLWKLFGTTIQT